MKFTRAKLLFALTAACAITPHLTHANNVPAATTVPSRVPAGTLITVPNMREVRAFGCASSDCDDLANAENLDDARAKKLTKALEAVSEVIYGEDFAQHVRADNRWRAALGNKNLLTGQAVLKVYPSEIPAFAIVIVNGGGGDEAGHTNNAPPVLTTYSSVLDQWDDPETRGSLINTLAHEMSHLISQRSGDALQMAFLDRRFSMRPCRQIDLVSYKLGHVAQCTYEKKQKDDFNECIDALHHDMNIPWYTYPWAWLRTLCRKYNPGCSE